MIWVDYCIVGIVVASVVIGLLRGFVRDLLGLATWVFACAAAYFFGLDAANALSPYIATPAVRIVAGYALVFFSALFAGAILTHLMGLIAENQALAGINRGLGAIFGLLRGLVVVTFIVMLAGTSAARQDRWWRESTLIPPFVPFADALRGYIPERWLLAMRPQISGQVPSQAAPHPAVGF